MTSVNTVDSDIAELSRLNADYLASDQNMDVARYEQIPGRGLHAPLEEHQAVFAHTGANAEFAIVKPDHLATYFGEPFKASVAIQCKFVTTAL
jgi:hypothetical protein